MELQVAQEEWSAKDHILSQLWEEGGDRGGRKFLKFLLIQLCRRLLH